MGDVGDVAKALLELLKIAKELFPDKAEKFKKEWGKDEKVFAKAWKNRDIPTINRIFDKYWNMLHQI